ncbi:MAG: phospholipase D family protein [Gammaproteobacteria bacterium]|nr:phospholipase D family protein [Gammaproteobacteria bacterium]
MTWRKKPTWQRSSNSCSRPDPAARTRTRTAGRLAAAICGLLVAGCSGLPALDGRTVTQAITDTDDTRLGRAIGPHALAHPEQSGVIALPDGRGAFASRVLLAEAAQRTLDVQYYIWRDDMSGTLLFRSLQRAAKRGVRVRLLLDDNNTAGLDTLLAALDAQPNVEVRLFNPFVQRRARWLGYLTDLSRLNRRMHNKSFTADNQATIVGGRNVGDEYFEAGDGVLFADLDVLAVGPVVREVSADFDRYWASASSYPLNRLVGAVDQARLEALDARAQAIEGDPAAAAYMRALQESEFVRRMLDGSLAFEWTTVRMVSDDPAKGLGTAAPEALVAERLKSLLGGPSRELQLVSPYFVPTAAGVEAFTAMTRRGVRVAVLTNSLAATDVAAVHAGYAKWRKSLLASGVVLYESRSTLPRAAGAALAGTGSSASSLHAKTFAVDGARVFVGSFNFDPRSVRLNTEMGFVIDSATMAGRLAEIFANDLPSRAYEVRLGDDGALRWLEREGDVVIAHDIEPRSGFGLRLAVWMLSLLPIDWML